MSDTPISLSKFRKAKARAEKKAQADANAVKFGRTRAEKARDDAAEDARKRLLDGHRRDEDRNDT